MKNQSMSRRRDRVHAVVWRSMAIVVCLSAIAAGGKASKKAKQIPPFSVVQKAVVQNFAEREGFQSRDILSKADVVGVLELLEELGWEVPTARQITADALGDSDFIVRTLRAKSGVPFMRQISKYPLAYDRLDRLSHMDRGHKMVSNFIRDKDGYKMIEYMTTAPGGKGLGRQLARSPNGKNFNRPTGKIYTVDHLIERLRAAHAEQIAQLKKNGDSETDAAE